MSAPAASPSNSPVPPVVSTPPAPDVVATPPAPVSLPPVPVVSSPPPVSPSPPPPSLAPPPPSSPPPVVPSSPPPPVDNPSPPSPLVVLPPLTSPLSPQPPSTPSPPPPSTSTPSSPPPSTSSPSPPAPAVPSPPPPVQDTPSPPPPVDASPPTDSTTPAPPNDAVSPSPSRKQRSPPPSSRKLAPPPPAENGSVPPSPPLSAPPFNSPPGSPVALSPPPLSPGGNTTTPSGNPGTPSVPSSGVPGTSITTDTSSSSVSSSAIVGIAIGGIAVLALLALMLVCCARKKNRSGSNYDHSQDFRAATSFYNKDDSYYDPGRGRFDSGFSTASDATGRPFFPPRPPPTLGHSPTQGTSNNGSNFSYEVLAQATNGFSQVNMLGEGGFGCVYKGILPGGQEVAVKQLKVGGGQGEREFRAEVEIITRIHHRHLVTLVGFCISDTQRLLVYEYVPNGTLEYHLHGKGKNKALLDWSLRVKIAIGAARGLAYLHEDCHPKIIHRDIKSSNILLDNNFEAQVSDFGLAKLANDAHTHVSTRVMGTFGYLAPEYASTGKLTDKSDIYSFGVVLLELVTGRKPVDTSQPLGEESLVEWARPLLTQALETRNVDLLADPSLINYDNDEMLRMVGAAATCIRHSANKRPKLSRIVRTLENDSGTGFTDFHDSPFASEDYDNAQYSSDLRRFRKMALGTSQEYGSEYSGATSDYGVNPSVSSGEFPSKDWTSKTGRESELPLRSRQM